MVAWYLLLILYNSKHWFLFWLLKDAWKLSFVLDVILFDILSNRLVLRPKFLKCRVIFKLRRQVGFWLNFDWLIWLDSLWSLLENFINETWVNSFNIKKWKFFTVSETVIPRCVLNSLNLSFSFSSNLLKVILCFYFDNAHNKCICVLNILNRIFLSTLLRMPSIRTFRRSFIRTFGSSRGSAWWYDAHNVNVFDQLSKVNPRHWFIPDLIHKVRHIQMNGLLEIWIRTRDLLKKKWFCLIE